MHRLQHATHLALSGALLLICSEAAAGELEAPDDGTPEPHIYDGQPAATCQWSMVPAFNTSHAGCSAALIHPQMIATAAHCVGGNHPAALFGELAASPEHYVALDYCWVSPVYDGGVGDNDVAFCVLPEPVDLPYAPPAYGCELALLDDGADVTVVGYGKPNAGDKYWKDSVLRSLPTANSTAIVGGPESPGCSGDSGGPALIQLADGSWRTFAVLSGGPSQCGADGYSYYAWIYEWIPWIEEQSGIDVTPCHDADGSWNPTPLCGGFSVDPLDPGSGSWADWCAGTPVSDAGESCGPAAEPDVDPPHVAIVEPTDQAIYDESAVLIDVLVEANDDPWPVASVELFVDGDHVASDHSAPWTFESLVFPEGSWTLVVRAEDLSGNVGESDPIEIHVGEQPEDTQGEAEETGESGGPSLDDEQSGCACVAGNESHGAMAMGVLGLLLIARPRRPRRD